MFCELSDLFGKPNQGAHSIRIPILNLALVDVIATIILSYILYNFLQDRFKNINPYMFSIAIVVFTILVHKLFCVKTQLNKILGV